VVPNKKSSSAETPQADDHNVLRGYLEKYRGLVKQKNQCGREKVHKCSQ